jgi:chromate reductase, NAD(P)H dehydrogenase (quinone)
MLLRQCAPKSSGVGGEAYVTFKPDLVDDESNMSNEGTRKFLQEFLDKFTSLVVRLSPQGTRSAA